MSYQGNDKIAKAIALSEGNIGKSKSGTYEAASLFNLFNFYHKDLDNEKLAEMYYEELLAAYPDNDLTQIAAMDMGEEISCEASLSKTSSDEGEEFEELIVPDNYLLSPAYPNPFNPSTTLEYDLPLESKVSCTIYNLKGLAVRNYHYDQSAGTHSIIWDASHVPSGIYIIRFNAQASDGSASFVDYQKVTLLK